MCSSFHWSFLGGLLRCSSSLHCVFIGQVSCSLSSAQAKGRDVVNQAGDACITSFPCAAATVLCSLWQEPSQVSQHSSLGKRNNVMCICNLRDPPWMHIAPQNVPLSTKLVWLGNVLVKFWEIYGSVAALLSIDQPLVTATTIIEIITCFILFGNFHIQQTWEPQSQVDNKVNIVLNVIALAI